MSVIIKTVTSKRDFRVFARFANNLYKGNKYYVPSMPFDDLNTFDKQKNGAYEFSEAEFYLAYKDGKVAGRVAAIINRKGDGFCPMETATEKAESPEEALELLKEKLNLRDEPSKAEWVEAPILKEC